MTANPQTRLKDLSTTIGQIHTLITRLRTLSTSATASIGQGDQARLELGAEIHAQLKEAEEELEIVRAEVEAVLEESGALERRRRGWTGSGTGSLGTEREAERERVVLFLRGVEGDLKRTRGEFRSAQLQAKQNAEIARRKERELLFSRSGDNNAEISRRSTEKLTQDDLMVNASSDVTSALKRTYQLMQAELSRSQFAQQTLDQSTAALSSLSDSYSTLGNLLSSSRTLLGSLLRSQKSDTWYLETAFYILICTISWLVFRRILYGPVWWLILLPLRLLVRVTLAVLGAVGLSNSGESAVGSAGAGSTMLSNSNTPAPFVYGTGSGSVAGNGKMPLPTQADGESMVDRIGKMAGDSGSIDLSPEEREREPRNPKKRMYEEDVGGYLGYRDEL